jgi:hypothetical protein
MSNVYVELPPQAVRTRALAVFVLGGAMILLGIAVLPWLHVSLDEFYEHVQTDVALYTIATSTRFGDIVGVAMTVTTYMLAIALLAYAWFLVETLRALIRGYPRTKAGTFGDELVRGWRSPLRARVHVWSLLAFPLLVCIVTPSESTHMFEVSIEMHVTYGAYVVFAGIAVLAAGIEWLARVPGLAATQCWRGLAPAIELPAAPPVEDVVEEIAPPTSRKPSERPMLASSPLPPPPVLAGADPFRGGVSPIDLESKLVRHDTAPVAAPRADTTPADATPPALLR